MRDARRPRFVWPSHPLAGLWGCGAFRGDPHLKTLVQLMAAAVCRRGILFFTFSNAELSADIADLHTSLVARGISVGTADRRPPPGPSAGALLTGTMATAHPFRFPQRTCTI